VRIASPGTRLQWELSGAGLENLALEEREIPRPAADELLVRIDACGICFSDIKILNLGDRHPRLSGRDLREQPVVMGHETAMTVVEAGAALRDSVSPGQRFLVQADVYYQGQGTAFGYRLPGGYTQYQRVGKEILEGDEGCYLLPVTSRLGHAAAALCEPWACVEAAYSYRPRTEPRVGGRKLLVLLDNREPVGLPVSFQPDDTLRASECPWVTQVEALPGGLEPLKSGGPFSDICVSGERAQAGPLLSALPALLDAGGVLLVAGPGSAGAQPVDIGSIHYRNHWYAGVAGDGNPYHWSRSAELTPGGVAWFVGAGGPLGQMHLARALSLEQPPRKLIVTQNGGPRLEDLRERFSDPAAARGVELVLLDARALGDGVYDRVRAESGGGGCDDICVIIPNAAVTERAYELLAPGGGLDVFAGVPVGTTARLDLERVARDGVRLWGTSGSSIADLRSILEKAEEGALATDSVVAAVGGIEAVRDGLVAVRDGTFLGKTVIYPHCAGLPLTPLAELAVRHPSFGATLRFGKYWTAASEAELLRLYGSPAALS
jgi:threonine dehydrogenase-like Zn-dependent dehydrogenase